MVYLPQVHATPTPLALDGIGNDTPCQVNCIAQLLTTTKSYDVIMVIVESWSTNDTITAIVDSNGLNFIPRVAFGANGELWEYYARATSPLKSDNITVVFGAATTAALQVLAIHGANTRSIFDANPSIPSTESCPGVVCGACEVLTAGACVAFIQTTTIDFVIASTVIDDPLCGPGYPNAIVLGFTNILYSSRFEVDYAITSMPRSNVVFSCNGTHAMEIVLDAISFNGPFGS